jgi:hypothetical protein
MKARSACVGAVLVSLSAVGCGGGDPSSTATDQQPRPKVSSVHSQQEIPTEPVEIGHGREPQFFDSIEALVKASDLVLVGEVVNVVAGRKVEGFQYRVDEVRVTRSIKGRPIGPTVLVEELGWLNDTPWTLNDAAWAMPGDQAVMALVEKEGETWQGRTVYRLTSTQARFFFGSDDSLHANYLGHAAHDPFVEAQVQKGRNALLAQLASLTASE